MRSFSLAGSLVAAFLAGAAVPACANTTSLSDSQPSASRVQTRVADFSSPAGMQERSRRSEADSDEAAPDEDAGDQRNDDELDSTPLADRGSDFTPPDGADGPDERGYRNDPDSGADGEAPPEGYEDGDRDGQSDEDDNDDDNDDESGIHQA